MRSALLVGSTLLLLFTPPILAGPLDTNPPLWLSHAGSVGGSYDVTVSPDGSRVYAVGESMLPASGFVGIQPNGLVRALHAVTGAELWRVTGDGGGFYDTVSVVATSPDGSVVFAAGRGGDWLGGGPPAVTAIDAATGAILWTAGGSGDVEPRALAAAGGRLYLSGTVGNQVAVLRAYDAGTGAQLWTFEGPWGDFQLAPMAVTSDGARVFLGVTAYGCGDVYAIHGATGGLAWEGNLVCGPDASTGDVVLSPDGTDLYAVGYLLNVGYDLAFASLDPSTGIQRWAHVREAPGWQRSWNAVVAPAGWLAIAAEEQAGPEGFLALRVDPETGDIVWASSAAGRSNVWPQVADAVVAGDRVVLTGTHYPAYPDAEVEAQMQSAASTIAFDGATGAFSWEAHIDAPVISDQGTAIAAAPDGSQTFVSIVGTGSLVASYVAALPR